MGRLSGATLDVGGVPVEVWVYSRTGKVRADEVLSRMRNTLESAAAFLNGLPVDRYAFLWDFDDQTGGAWEHSYSSEYVLAEPAAWSPRFGQSLTDIAAHEFFHVMTPLNIHSEIIEHFNFETPVPSQHLWLYEGVTEWAANIMQLRSDLIQLPRYLNRMLTKIRIDRTAYDQGYSLRELALTSYSDSGQAQYGNIYQRGALVAGLLDIRLLELSGGKAGLRELILQLAKRYGKSHPFPESDFFDVVTRMTYPEIGDFFDRYVKRADPLPIAEYYAKLGIRFVDGPAPRFEIMRDATPAQVALRRAWLALRPVA
jgi:predicted metalloprotease with PDZ domain